MLRTEINPENSQSSTAIARAGSSTGQRSPSSTKASREDIRSLSRPEIIIDEGDHVSKAVGIATDAVKEAGDTSVKIGQSTLAGIKNLVDKGSGNENIKKSFLTLIAGIFGLQGIKDSLGLSQIINDPKTRNSSSPLVFKGAKILAGSSIAYGLYKTIIGGAGLGTPGLIIGIATFIGLSFLTNQYENSGSGSGKVSNFFGLRKKLMSVMDMFKFRPIVDGD